MKLDNARLEEVIVEEGERKNTDGSPVLNPDGSKSKWSKKSIRVRQDTRAGDCAVIRLNRSVTENEAVMSDLLPGAIVNIDLGISYREYNGRYFNELTAWGIVIVQAATF